MTSNEEKPATLAEAAKDLRALIGIAYARKALIAPEAAEPFIKSLESRSEASMEELRAKVEQTFNFWASFGKVNDTRKDIESMRDSILAMFDAQIALTTKAKESKADAPLKVARFYKATPKGKRMLELMEQGKIVEEAAEIVVAESKAKPERGDEAG